MTEGKVGPPNLAIGRIVGGRYAVQGLLGRRRGWATYHAITEPNRQVALKLYDPALQTVHGALSLLRRTEARAAELPPSSVLGVQDEGVDEETGAPYSVMPLSDHPALEELVELCPLSVEEVARLVASAARGLAAAHGAGLLHLALRPTNLFVGPPPDCVTRIQDFGAAAVTRALGLGESEELSAWSAPEILAGGRETPQADVFGLGLLAFYALTGKSYWSGARPGGDPSGLRREIAGAWPSVEDAAGALEVDLPKEVASVIDRALAREPSKRFPSVEGFALALTEAAGLPPPTRRPEPEPFEAEAEAEQPLRSLRPPRPEAEEEEIPPPSMPEAAPSPKGASSAEEPAQPEPGTSAAPAAAAPGRRSSSRPPSRPSPPARETRWLHVVGAALGAAIAVGLFALVRSTSEDTLVVPPEPRPARPASSAPEPVQPEPPKAPPSVPTREVPREPTETPPPIPVETADKPRQRLPRAGRTSIEPIEAVWYGELRVLCVPECETVLVRGGSMIEPETPRRMEPGSYIVTVRQDGGIRSHDALLRSGERLTFHFD